MPVAEETVEDVLTDDDMLPSVAKRTQPRKVLSPAAQAWQDALQRGRASMETDLASVKVNAT